MKRIYVASSWRNEGYEYLVNRLRNGGHEVWDWRNPPNSQPGFKWSEIDPDYKHGDPVDTDTYRNWLLHPAAERGFANDRDGMMWAQIGVLLLPAGRSAHTEAGYMRGYGKPVFVLRPNDQEPDLMYKLFNGVFSSIPELVVALSTVQVA